MCSGNGNGQIERQISGKTWPNREKFSHRTNNPLLFVRVTPHNVILTQKIITLTQNVIQF